MSEPTTTPSPSPWDSLLHRIADKLIPLFQSGDADRAFAKQAAVSAIAAYHPEFRADFVNIARILAFSMASLSALEIAAQDDLPPAQKMRFFGRANALNRSADQNERTMMQRRRDQRTNPPADLPPHLQPQAPEPACASSPPVNEPDLSVAFPAIDAAVDEAMAAYQAAQTATPARPSIAPSAAAPSSIPAMQRSNEAPKSAIHLGASVYNQPQRRPYRQDLLHRSALPRVVDAALQGMPVTGRQANTPA